MTVSTSPWWCGPVLASGWTTTVPAQSFCAPVRAWEMAAARVMPGVCGVLVSRLLARTMRRPCVCQSGWVVGGSVGIVFPALELEGKGKYKDPPLQRITSKNKDKPKTKKAVLKPRRYNCYDTR